MANPKKINLGVFAAGEIPFSLVHQYKDNDKNPIDMSSGWTVFVEIEGPEEDGAYGTGTVAFSDASTGRVKYDWDTADFLDFGKYRMLFWTTDGTNRLASDLVVWEVYDGPGATP